MRGGGGTEVKAEASIIWWWGLVELWVDALAKKSSTEALVAPLSSSKGGVGPAGPLWPGADCCPIVAPW